MRAEAGGRASKNAALQFSRRPCSKWVSLGHVINHMYMSDSKDTISALF
jgi:hypothetical protein